jgi:hypothetical protein
MAGDAILKNTFAKQRVRALRNRRLQIRPRQETARSLLEANLKEEERMAAWIDANVGKVTQAYLANEQWKAA